MEIGMIGLGRMGGNMAQRLLRGGHRVVTYDANPEAVSVSRNHGAVAAASLSELVDALSPPRPVWIMLPPGEPTESTIDSLILLLSPNDIILDGGNANYKDSMRRPKSWPGPIWSSWTWAPAAVFGAWSMDIR